MKIVLFAGGAGTRFWPLSRNRMPKQFMPLINNQSTFARHFENLSKKYGVNNIYVAVNESLAGLVKNLFPQIPLTNIISEPAIRDVGPAVGLALMKVKKFGNIHEPIAIIWSDGYIGNYPNFESALDTSEKYIAKNPLKLVILGQKPTFPNENIGWMELGKVVSKDKKFAIYQRQSWHYRPPIELTQQWFKDGSHIWNTGFFVSTPEFLLHNYQKNFPKIYKQLTEIYQAFDTDQEATIMQKIYPEIEAVHFDHIVPEKLTPEESLVLEGNYEWQDPGTLYALKQFFQKSIQSNVTKGQTVVVESTDSLIYNLEPDKVLATIGLDGFVVVNMTDALFICHKDQIPKIKEVINKLKKKKLEQYL